MDNTLYTEVVFNQIAPDYLEGLLLIMPGEQIDQNFVYDIAKVISSKVLLKSKSLKEQQNKE